MDFYLEEPVIDLRWEFTQLLRGAIDSPGQGREVIVRRLSNTPCVCWDPIQGGPKGLCGYCQGEGWQFTETIELMYIAMGVAPVYKPGFLATGQYPQVEMGDVDPNRATGYCEYTVFPDYEVYSDNTKKNFSKLYELKVKPEGGTFYPLTRVSKWRILNITPMHGDNGRIEFFELSLAKENS